MLRKRAWSAARVGGEDRCWGALATERWGALATERWAGKPTGAMGSDCVSSTPTPSPSPVMDELGEMWRATSLPAGAWDGEGGLRTGGRRGSMSGSDMMARYH